MYRNGKYEGRCMQRNTGKGDDARYVGESGREKRCAKTEASVADEDDNIDSKTEKHLISFLQR